MSAVRTWWVGRDVYGDKDELYFCTYWLMIFLPALPGFANIVSFQGEELYP